MSAATTPLIAGFDDPVLEAGAVFRTVLDAMARPGRVRDCPVLPAAPEGLDPVAFAVIMTLCDPDTPVWLSPACDTPAARANIAFHTGAPVVEDPGGAAFAVLAIAEADGVLTRLSIGTPEYPDRSATAIVLVPELRNDGGAMLSGPGIDGSTRLSVGGPDATFWPVLAQVNAPFPLGIDVVLAAPGRLAAVPRSSKTEV